MTYVGSAQLSALKVKRNQFPYVVPGLPNHQFGYVVHGSLTIYNGNAPYILCSRSADGYVICPAPSFLALARHANPILVFDLSSTKRTTRLRTARLISCDVWQDQIVS